MPCSMLRVLTDSLTHAFAMYENRFQNKRFLFQFYWTYSDNIVGPPSDIFHWTYSENIVDNPPIYFIGHIPKILVDNPPIETVLFKGHVMHSHPIYAMSPCTCNANTTAWYLRVSCMLFYPHNSHMNVFSIHIPTSYSQKLYVIQNKENQHAT